MSPSAGISPEDAEGPRATPLVVECGKRNLAGNVCTLPADHDGAHMDDRSSTNLVVGWPNV